MHWLMVRLISLYPAAPFVERVAYQLDTQFTAQKIAGECAYLRRHTSRTFERTYGWAWLLALQGELMSLARQHAARQGPGLISWHHLLHHVSPATSQFPAAGRLSNPHRHASEQRLRAAAGTGYAALQTEDTVHCSKASTPRRSNGLDRPRSYPCMARASGQ